MNSEMWSAKTADGRAREAAVTRFAQEHDFLFRTVDYVSEGRSLIIGPGARVAAFMASRQQVIDRAEDTAATDLQYTIVVTDAERPSVDDDGVEVYQADDVDLSGYLGQWTVNVKRDDREMNLGALVYSEESPCFDLVFDLEQRSMIEAETAPLGYFCPVDADATQGAIAQAAELVGEFQKPKFFKYDSDICAHGRSGITGCTRCIDACPTDAIISIGEEVEVNAYLCQGGGVCATACPSGAMTYMYPPVTDLLSTLRDGLNSYAGAGGTAACVVFHDDESGRDAVYGCAETLPENWLPFAIEEAGSTGADIWLAALAWGAASVRLVVTATTPPSVRQELAHQVRVVHSLLDGLGIPAERVDIVEGASLSGVTSAAQSNHAVGSAGPAAQFAPVDGKRNMIRIAVDYLARTAFDGQSPPAVLELCEDAPFGQVNVDTDACTLCMSCASVCPTAAITAGGETPALRFTEWNCVQCGTCETACPENAITLVSRFLLDNDQRMSARTLYEEAPFLCVGCAKPFATASVMSRMQEKLKDHWMFQDPDQMRRLQMCEDCRVKDLYASEGGLTLGTTKPE